jgi:hypothetical protein
VGDVEPVVRESCVVALDTIEYWDDHTGPNPQEEEGEH